MPNQSEIVMIFPTTIQVTDLENAAELNAKLCKGTYELMKT